MKYDIIKSFKGSPDGCLVVQYNEGDKDVEMTDSLAQVALAEKWVKPSKSSKKDAELAVKEEKRQEKIASLQSEIAELEELFEQLPESEKKSTMEQIDVLKQELASIQG